MTRCVTVYGFGSAFCGSDEAEDVDLLVVHQGTDQASCLMAILCKRRLIASVARAHVVMVSDVEEEYFRFIETSRAIFLGMVREDRIDSDLAEINGALPQFF